MPSFTHSLLSSTWSSVFAAPESALFFTHTHTRKSPSSSTLLVLFLLCHCHRRGHGTSERPYFYMYIWVCSVLNLFYFHLHDARSHWDPIIIIFALLYAPTNLHTIILRARGLKSQCIFLASWLFLLLFFFHYYRQRQHSTRCDDELCKNVTMTGNRFFTTFFSSFLQY